MKLTTLPLIAILFLSSSIFGQIKIGDNSTTIEPRALLEMESTDKALYLPRLTDAQRDAHSDWKAGMVIYSATDSSTQFFDGVVWRKVQTTSSSENVYCDQNDPNTITTNFDDQLPVVAHDVSLTQSTEYTYFGLDGSTWLWNGTVYITYTPTIDLEIGEIHSMYRTIPIPSAAGTMLSSSGLLELDGMIRVNIEYVNSLAFKPTIRNISGANLTLDFQTTSSVVGQNHSVSNLTMASNAIAYVELDEICSWFSGSTTFTDILGIVTTTNYVYETVKTKVVLPNGSLYDIEWFAIEKGTNKHIYMNVTRKF